MAISLTPCSVLLKFVEIKVVISVMRGVSFRSRNKMGSELVITPAGSQASDKALEPPLRELYVDRV